MKQKAIFFVFAVLLLAPVNACSRKDPAGASKVDFGFIDNVWETLHENYYDPPQLDYQGLANAALCELSGDLLLRGVEYVLREISGQTYPDRRRQFFEEIKRAEKLAKGAVSEEHFFEFAVARAMLAAVGDSHTVFITPKIYEKEKKIFQVERDDVVLPVMKSEILNRDERRLGYLKIYSFLPQFRQKDIDELIGILGPAATDGAIIDLRGNSGGTISVLTACLGSFFETGTPLFATKSVRGQRVYHSEISVCAEKPITVLVNENSHSAAEVFPAVIQEKKRGMIVGKKTAGAVSVGRPFPLPYEAAMYVTIEQLTTAGGKKLERIGVTPDVEAAITKEDILNARDSQLEKAIEVLLEKIEQR